MKKLCLILTFCLICAQPALSATLIVHQDGSGDYSNIGSALTNASDGDIIRVGNGIYHESLVVNKSVTIEAEGGRPHTIVHGNDSYRIMLVEGNVDVVLRGLAFKNGYAADAAALLIWNGASVRVEDCLFEDNYATGSNAVHVRHSGTSASFLRCDFLNNECGVHSAALSIGFGGDLEVEECLFADNVSQGVAGAVNCNAGTVAFRGNLFLRNSGVGAGALCIQMGAGGEVSGNTFHGNTGGAGHGAVDINSQTSFTRNIVTRSHTSAGLSASSGSPRSCNLYYDNDGGSVFDMELGENELMTDPLYCDYPGGIFTLCEISPALEINNGCGTMGAFGEGCSNCGPVATEQRSWDNLKSLYR